MEQSSPADIPLDLGLSEHVLQSSHNSGVRPQQLSEHVLQSSHNSGVQPQQLSEHILQSSHNSGVQPQRLPCDLPSSRLQTSLADKLPLSSCLGIQLRKMLLLTDLLNNSQVFLSSRLRTCVIDPPDPQPLCEQALQTSDFSLRVFVPATANDCSVCTNSF